MKKRSHTDDESNNFKQIPTLSKTRQFSSGARLKNDFSTASAIEPPAKLRRASKHQVTSRIQAEICYRSVTQTKLARTLHSGISGKMYPSSCDLCTQYQFMCEMYGLTTALDVRDGT